MSRVPGRKDFGRRVKRSEEQQRKERALRRGHTESKTFIVGGTISPALYVPPFFVAVDYDDETPEWKTLNGFRAQLSAGTATLDWLVNGSVIASQNVTTNPAHAPIVLADPLGLDTGDTIQIEVTAASLTAENLAAAAIMVTAPG